MAATREQLLRLGDPFEPGDIEWRVQQAGEKHGKPWARVLAYVDNRAIQQRLDDVVGPEHWQDEYRAGPAGGVLCGLSIRIARADGTSEWVTKWDGAENTDVEPVKGGLSNAMKRAAVHWGIGRYLYDLEEGWARVTDDGRFTARTKEGKAFRWNPPELPEWARPTRPMAASVQLAKIEALLERVRDERVVRAVGKRLADGMTTDAARECIKYLEGLAAPTSVASAVPTAAAVVAPEVAPAVPPAVAPVVAPPARSDAAPEGAACPKCGGDMWDNRASKANPKAPDFKCRDQACDGVLWPARAGRDAAGRNLAKVPPVAAPEPDPVSAAAAHAKGRADRERTKPRTVPAAVSIGGEGLSF